MVRVVDFKPLALTAVGSNLTRDIGFFYVRKLAYRVSVVLFWCQLMSEIMHRGVP